MSLSPELLRCYNAKAIRLFQQGRYNESHILYREILGALNSFLRVEQSLEMTKPESEEKAIQSETGLRTHFLMCEGASSEATVATPDNPFGSFCRAFEIPESQEGEDVDQVLTRNCGIILYNMAVVGHMRALMHDGVSSTSSSEQMTASLRLYTLAMSMLTRLGEERARKSMLLWLAVSTNICHIHAHFWRHSEAMEYRDFMMQLLTGVTSQDVDEGSITIEDYDTLVGNAIAFASFAAAAAPAA